VSVLADVDPLEPADVTAAAAAGDALAIEAIARLGSWLGVGLASLVSLLDPELVVVGGGVTDHIGRWLLPATTRAMDDQMFAAAYREAPAVRLATLGDTAGMIGAAEMARARAHA
jgi:glucokinase